MDVGEGMVAMVRGLRDAKLAVTLLDGTRKYTLMPNNVQFLNPTHVQIGRKQKHTEECVGSAPNREPTRCVIPTRCESPARCESGAQACDGRYTSMYKMAHCQARPTSPDVELTEFPPQRAEICPAHGNFEVGGAGSGDTYTPIRTSTNFRGGMSWTDRGAVYDPRPSHGPDAFANSLRRYPNVSPERSTEIVERLISYTQTKNAKNNNRRQSSPSRIAEDAPNRIQKTCELETNCRTKKEESPSRESRSRKCDSDCADFRRAVFRNYDVRYLRDVSKRTRDSARSLSTQHTNSVNMEIQAVVEMTSREVATVPRLDPSKRNVAVPLSPAPSTVKRNKEGEDRPSASCPTSVYKNVQTAVNRQKISLAQFKSVQTSFSSIQLSNPGRLCRCSYHDYRKSKSEEEVRIRGGEEESALFKGTTNFYATPKRMFCKTKNITKNADRLKFSNDFKNIPNSCTECVNCDYTFLLNDTDTCPLRNSNDNLEVTINELLKEIPIKNRDLLGRYINRQQLANTIASKLKQIILNAKDENSLESGIVKLIAEIPIDVNDVNKEAYVNSLAKKFLQNIIKIFKLDEYKEWKNIVDRSNKIYERERNLCSFISKNVIKSTEVEEFVREILLEFFYEYKFRICSKHLRDVETELIDMLSDLSSELHTGNDIIVKKELFFILHEIGLISKHQAILLTDILLERFKSFINVHDYKMKKYGHRQTFVVLQNTTQSSPHPVTNTNGFSIESISQRDIDACLDFYMTQLSQEINSWLSRVLGSGINSIRAVAVNDLADDIIDRLKYLEKNPAKQGSENDELEVMRFQIYKWIHKLVSDDAVQQAIERAPELMERLRTIPVPMLSRPVEYGYTLDETLPPCCVTQSTLINKEFRPNPWFKDQSSRQSPTNYDLPEPAFYNAPGQSGSEIGRPILENRFQGVEGNIPEEIIMQDAGNLNINQMPMFGPASGGGSMVEAPGRKIFTKKQFSLPGVFASGPITQGVRNININPSLNPNGQIANAIQAPNNQNLTNSRPHAPWSLASAPMFQNSENVNLSRTHTYASTGPGLSMLEVRKPVSPKKTEEVVPEYRKYNINEMPMFGVAGKGGSMIDAGSSKARMRRMSSPGLFASGIEARSVYRPAPSSPRPDIGRDPRQSILFQLNEINQSVNGINTQYDQFLKNWVKELPLPTATPEDNTLADTIRSKFYKGVWKAILKVNLDPAKYTNRVYCQGVLDEEIQELFDLLPKTQELERNKDALKTNLLQKTSDAVSMMLAKSRASNYKQQLIEQMSNHLPNRAKISSDFQTDIHEELQKMQVVDAFILYTRYLNENDNLRANIYKKKLIDRVEDILRNLKHIHKASLANIDVEVFKNEVINALHKVPLPTADVIKEEADEILVGIEIEKWFLDLPIVANIDPAELLDRRRIRYAFTKQIHEMEKETNFADASSVEQLKIATMRFLRKLPFQQNQQVNLSFLAEEFVNRLKNSAREKAAQRTKSVSFEAPAVFGNFAKNVPLSSSVAEVDSYMIDRQDRSQFYESNRGQSGRSVQIDGGYESSQPQPQWLSLFPVSSGFVNSELLAPFVQQSRQDDQESRHMPHYSQQAERTIVSHQIISENQNRSSNQGILAPVFYTEAPKTTSFRGSIPVIQPITTTEARIVTESQPGMVSGSPGQQRSNRIMFNAPEVLTAPPQIEPGNQQVGQTYNGFVGQPVPGRPVGVLGTSQIAGSSGRPPIPRSPKPPTIVPNIIVNEPTLRSYELPQAVLSSPTGDPQSAQTNQVPASNIPIDRVLQGLSAPLRADHVQPAANFYISNQLPVANSTPQQRPPRGAPPKLERKRPREPENRRDGARRRLDLEDTDESESDEIQCTCMERTFRCRRRRPYYDCDDYDMMECPRYFPMRYPHPYFF